MLMWTGISGNSEGELDSLLNDGWKVIYADQMDIRTIRYQLWKSDKPSELQDRIAELEAENARLQARLAELTPPVSSPTRLEDEPIRYLLMLAVDNVPRGGFFDLSYEEIVEPDTSTNYQRLVPYRPSVITPENLYKALVEEKDGQLQWIDWAFKVDYTNFPF